MGVDKVFSLAVKMRQCAFFPRPEYPRRLFFMARIGFGAFLAPHHPIGENPILQFRQDLDFAEHLDKLVDCDRLRIFISTLQG